MVVKRDVVVIWDVVVKGDVVVIWDVVVIGDVVSSAVISIQLINLRLAGGSHTMFYNF